ncbi:MAG: hypothetical protein J2P43_14140 [Candidatus Dormibacteraeota bacterium]|nr:hypothetical protein [Candidatus Dormibacteraeota bacterium]
MVPGWLIVPVLIVGLLVGAALGWWMRQRTLAGAQPAHRWGEEPASPSSAVATPGPPEETASPASVAAPQEEAAPPSTAPAKEDPVTPPPVDVAPESPSPRASTEAPIIIPAPASEPPAPAVEQLRLQPEVGTAPAPEAGSQVPDPQAEAAAAPEVEREAEVPSEPSSSVEHPVTDEDTASEGERLDARMEDVLSELERRYRGRRVGPGEAQEEPGSTSRPRRPRPQP